VFVNGIVFGSVGCDVKDIPSTTGRISLQQIDTRKGGHESGQIESDDSVGPSEAEAGSRC
jgi:hypothetical protein